MEDATITEKTESLIKERFPSVVDTDDLIFELGKQTVKAINYEKLLNSMVHKTQELSAATSEVARTKSNIEAEKQELQKSNALYQENNRKLDAALVQIRNEKEQVGNEKVALEKVILEKDKQQSETIDKVAVLSESNKMYEENNRKLDAEIVRLGEEIARLNTLKDEEIASLTNGLARKDEEIKLLKQKKKPVKKRTK